MWIAVQLAIAIVAAYILQATVVPHIGILGAKPDIILIIAALYGFTYGSPVGVFAGFFGGLLGDMLSGTYIGFGLVSKSIVGLFTELVQKTIFVENILLPMLAIFVATWINEFIYVGFMFLFGETVPVKLLIAKIILPSAIYNSVLTPFVYAIIRRLMVFKQDNAPSLKIAGKL